MQITAARHDFKTDCGVGVTTCFDILAMVGYPPRKSGNTVLRDVSVRKEDTSPSETVRH